jgi:hypothetical protein
MKSSQIRITRTPELSEVLESLKSFYKGLSENEIIKKAVIEDYRTRFPYEIFPAEKISPAEENEISEILEEVKNGEFSGPFTPKESLSHLQSISHSSF